MVADMNDPEAWETARNLEQETLEKLRRRLAEVLADTNLDPFAYSCLSSAWPTRREISRH